MCSFPEADRLLERILRKHSKPLNGKGIIELQAEWAVKTADRHPSFNRTKALTASLAQHPTHRDRRPPTGDRRQLAHSKAQADAR